MHRPSLTCHKSVYPKKNGMVGFLIDSLKIISEDKVNNNKKVQIDRLEYIETDSIWEKKLKEIKNRDCRESRSKERRTLRKDKEIAKRNIE